MNAAELRYRVLAHGLSIVMPLDRSATDSVSETSAARQAAKVEWGAARLWVIATPITTHSSDAGFTNSRGSIPKRFRNLDEKIRRKSNVPVDLGRPRKTFCLPLMDANTCIWWLLRRLLGFLPVISRFKYDVHSARFRSDVCCPGTMKAALRP